MEMLMVMEREILAMVEFDLQNIMIVVFVFVFFKSLQSIWRHLLKIIIIIIKIKDGVSTSSIGECKKLRVNQIMAPQCVSRI